MTESPRDFVVVIPAADRPRQLAACLESLLALLLRHPYSGRVTALIAEDSHARENIERHRALAADFPRRGLDTHYLSQEEQRILVEALPPALRGRLANVIGNGMIFSHKGASVTRNIAYLWLNRLRQDGRKRLFWFVDSDQEFQVEVETSGGKSAAGDIDYFHWLDRIFSATPTRVLTGKVTGDPPVSPAVMAGTFLDDVHAFVEEMAVFAPRTACSFHGQAAKQGDAAYHDMADLFGFKPATGAWRYRCTLQGEHDHAACLAGFASRLTRFFDGEHPTRQSFYQPGDVMASLKPARTIYTGNYVIEDGALDYFIPFAALKLRMAGPTLGRIIQAEQGEKFVAANLPLLHKRTMEAIGQSEYRAGIERKNSGVDLSGEFERQYFGDVMLFSMEKLTRQGFPRIPPEDASIIRTVAETEAEMHTRYRASREQVQEKLARLRTLFFGRRQPWWQEPALAEACGNFKRFIGDMQANFVEDSPAWRLIGSTEHRQARRQAISEAIRQFRNDRKAWQEALKNQ
jgi:hypothetical protein